MKKIFTFFIILFLPVNILAYSKYIIPGGESIGIDINSDGLVVVGYYKVNNEYIAKNNILIGDKIIKANNKYIYSINDLSNIVDESINNNSTINIEIIRNNKAINTTLYLVKDNGIYKTGLYIKDSLVGLGTLTYIDPNSFVYGALGHEITFSETSNAIDIRDGNILSSKITSITKSKNGFVGSKEAKIDYSNLLGNIKLNTNKGIYGIYTSVLPKKNLYEIGYFNDIEKGKAIILTVVDNKKIESFNINIIEKYYSKKDSQKAFSFIITDEKLLSITGGVVQGMSGSPIIQNGKIIGAVTNVVVDNVKYGYGISIITMLKEGDKIS